MDFIRTGRSNRTRRTNNGTRIRNNRHRHLLLAEQAHRRSITCNLLNRTAHVSNHQHNISSSLSSSSIDVVRHRISASSLIKVRGKHYDHNDVFIPKKKVLYAVDGSVLPADYIDIVTSTSGHLLGGSPEFDEKVVEATVAPTNRVFTNWLDWVLTAMSMEEEDHHANNVNASDEAYYAVDMLDRLAGLFLADTTSHHHNYNHSFAHLAKSVATTTTCDGDDEAEKDLDDDSDAASSTDSEISEDHFRLHLNMDAFLYDDTFTHSRIDTTINQMDISKMARNASRHLNLKSIHELPTKIYRSNNSDVATSACIISPSTSIDESWHVVSVPPKQPSSSSHNNMNIQHDKKNEKCVICLTNFQDGDKLRVLPCGHLFHVGCIDHWLLGTYSDDQCITTGCPTCKKTVECEVVDGDVNHLQEEEVASADGSSEASDLDHADSSFPSWAFFRLGSMLSKDSDSNDSSRS